MKEAVKSLKDKIDNYEQTIIAIIGFMNFYKFNSDKTPCKLFQGRKLTPTQENGTEFLTPDIGILQSDNSGVIGEVKHCFPKDQDLWVKSFEQLKKYDDVLEGWPNKSGFAKKHDIVLLTHQTRVRAVANFYRRQAKNKKLRYVNPFSIIEYNRTSGSQEFFFFRIEQGALTDKKVYSKLKEGAAVPMNVFVENYAPIKFYDDKPETPYLMFLIWVYIVLVKASENEKFKHLNKSQKLDIEFSIEEIVNSLRNGYSFKLINSENSERQPLAPRTSWVKEACNKFVEWGEAKWEDTSKMNITFHCNKKYTDVLNQFIEKYAGESDDAQGTLFDLELKEN